MSWGVVAVAAISAVGTAVSSSQAKKGEPNKVNVAQTIQDAATQQKNDLQNSINLEQQFLPGTTALRTQSNSLNSNLATGNTPAQQQQQALLTQAGAPITNPNSAVNNPLTSASLTSILQSLAQGGNLDPDTQAQATQAALQGAGSAGISGSGAGRGLVARDLGLTSLQLLQSRQNQASAAGNSYGALALQGQGLQLQDYISRLGALSGAVGQQQQYGLGLGTLLNNTALPNSGLTGTQVAQLDVGNTNIANQASAMNAQISSQATNAYTSDILSAYGGGGGGGGVGSGLAGLFGGSGGGGSAAGASANGLF